jgi:hypothetical protein
MEKLSKIRKKELITHVFSLRLFAAIGHSWLCDAVVHVASDCFKRLFDVRGFFGARFEEWNVVRVGVRLRGLQGGCG